MLRGKGSGVLAYDEPKLIYTSWWLSSMGTTWRDGITDAEEPHGLSQPEGVVWCHAPDDDHKKDVLGLHFKVPRLFWLVLKYTTWNL